MLVLVGADIDKTEQQHKSYAMAPATTALCLEVLRGKVIEVLVQDFTAAEVGVVKVADHQLLKGKGVSE